MRDGHCIVRVWPPAAHQARCGLVGNKTSALEERKGRGFESHPRSMPVIFFRMTRAR